MNIKVHCQKHTLKKDSGRISLQIVDVKKNVFGFFNFSFCLTGGGWVSGFSGEAVRWLSEDGNSCRSKSPEQTRHNHPKNDGRCHHCHKLHPIHTQCHTHLSTGNFQLKQKMFMPDPHCVVPPSQSLYTEITLSIYSPSNVFPPTVSRSHWRIILSAIPSDS